MKEIILGKLREIEEKEKVKIILAVESGSRAWGFASPDSDYDVRFIYVRPKEDYLKLEPVRDVIEWQLDETLDINGWDLKKTLQLLYKGNSTIFEWCASPVVYLDTPEADVLRALLPVYFSSKKGLFHYWHMADSNYRSYLKGDMVRIKKYFYVLGPILAAKWIIDRESPPPMLFSELVDAELEADLRPVVERLLDMKVSMPETEYAPKVQVLNDYIEEGLKIVKEIAEEVEAEPVGWEKLDEVFLEIVG